MARLPDVRPSLSLWLTEGFWKGLSLCVVDRGDVDGEWTAAVPWRPFPPSLLGRDGQRPLLTWPGVLPRTHPFQRPSLGSCLQLSHRQILSLPLREAALTSFNKTTFMPITRLNKISRLLTKILFTSQFEAIKTVAKLLVTFLSSSSPGVLLTKERDPGKEFVVCRKSR